MRFWFSLSFLLFMFALSPLLAQGQDGPPPAPEEAAAPAETAPIVPPVDAPAPGLSAGEVKPSGLPEYKRQVRLTLADAQRIALENNPDVENARRDVKVAELDITRALAAYDPYIRVDASYSRNQRPSSQAAFGESSESGSVTVGTGVNTTTGGSMSVDFRSTRSESDSFFSTLNPSYSTDLTLNVRQPILRGRYNNTMEMDLAQKNAAYQRSLIALRSKELDIESQVEDAYWGLYRARMDLDSKNKSVDLALRMDLITKAQIRAGVQPQVQSLQTEASLASAQSTLVRSQNEYKKSQNNFKLILNVMDPEAGSLEIIPAGVPPYLPPDFDREEFFKEAMSNNFSIRQKQLSLIDARISLEQAENRALPQLDARASVGVSGLAGTSNPSDTVVETGFVVPNPFPSDQSPAPYIVERVVVPDSPSEYEGDYIDSVDNMLTGDNVSWSAGVTYQTSPGNRAAKADLERQRISYERSLDDLKYTEQQTFLNVLALINDVDAAHSSLLAAQEAARLQQKNLETEEKKFALGLNTSYEVLQAEQNYMDARTGETGAVIEYAKVMTRVERAREGYLGGSGFSATSISGLTSGLPSGISIPSGIDSSMIQQYSSMLPAGIDINSIMSLIP